MIIKKIIDKFRNKGYDDFYMADFARKHEDVLMFSLGLLQCGVLALIFGELKVMSVTLFVFGAVWISAMLFIFCFCYIPSSSILISKSEIEKGQELDLRGRYAIASIESKFMLKAVRYAPAISVILLIASYILSLFKVGFSPYSLIAFVVGGALLLATSRLYHKTLAKIIKEANFYVDWTTDKNVEHFDELLSRHEKWRTPSALLDFEKFNVDRYRNIRAVSVIGTLVCMLTGLVYALGIWPYCVTEYTKLSSERVELAASDSMETDTVSQMAATSVEVADEVQNVVENKDNEEHEDDTTEDDRESNSREDYADNRIADHRLSDLDKMPVFPGSEDFKSGIQNYLLRKVPTLKEKRVFVEFCVNEKGVAYHIDTSLIHDADLAQQVSSALKQMPHLQPGEIEGQPVCFVTNIQF